MKKQPGQHFTLIELVIVIVIFAVMAALLLPASQSAEAQARDTACRSNLGQLGTAVAAFVNDNNGVYPGQGCGAQNLWGHRIASYLGITTEKHPVNQNLLFSRTEDLPVFRCPSDPDPKYKTNPADRNAFGAGGTSYSVNRWLCWNENDNVGRKPNFIQSPGQVIVITEAANRGFPSMDFSSHRDVAYNHSGEGRIVASSFEEAEAFGDKLGVNIAFADGHADKRSGCITTNDVWPEDKNSRFYWWRTK